ncbi:hypothetical protein [Chitinophaga sp. YIM B06452]|uniref:hypothetical protein n=1 Tax=Chitinophaga sp. YIM B06452 TaxID=3082158 RepID=UPI0031FECA27
MKSFKLSFALIIAVLAVGVTFATNASALAGKIVTGCWKANSLTIQVRDLANPSSPTSSEIFSPVYDVTSCTTVDTEVFTNGKSFLRVATGSPAAQVGCDLVSADFCCLTLQEIASPNDPLYADVPFINLGDGNKKYEISEVRCKP